MLPKARWRTSSGNTVNKQNSYMGRSWKQLRKISGTDTNPDTRLGADNNSELYWFD